ncbi:MAG: peptidoglycan endopeptidase [Runella slithyformis]|nr:MAG: peptidoglycan endopeptidase [Runella slithyformis]TAF96360.1 MAG: peptidoglycan endopeptidase [Runella sp.]TAG18915.1 MAG: peptidoglycan endopeptidase [Cytophagales bacterium]TAG39573.1 MAG: peptidoglycan endopeptidase [Cytophagia bacterium]TAF24629.1 MAG: peptidoglycan endopeptidase [Runella slithyformis]
MFKKIFFCCLFLFSFSSFAQVTTDSTAHASPVKSVLDFARKHLHIRYRGGGTSTKGFDCSGFVRHCFTTIGVRLPHSSAAQILEGIEVKINQVRPGDLLFFKGSNAKSTRVGHVGMVVEVTNGYVKFIHSAWKGGVRYDFLQAKYYQKRFVGVRRVWKKSL